LDAGEVNVSEAEEISDGKWSEIIAEEIIRKFVLNLVWKAVLLENFYNAGKCYIGEKILN
jgi:hypothetical protein